MTCWLAFDIGCLECGEESAVLGVFKSPKEAQAACDVAQVKQLADWHGQHNFAVFELEIPE